jgi:hypothetical protein
VSLPKAWPEAHLVKHHLPAPPPVSIFTVPPAQIASHVVPPLVVVLSSQSRRTTAIKSSTWSLSYPDSGVFQTFNPIFKLLPILVTYSSFTSVFFFFFIFLPNPLNTQATFTDPFNQQTKQPSPVSKKKKKNNKN